MEDLVPSENDSDVPNQLDDDVWGLEDIVDPAKESSRAKREVTDALDVKCRSAALPSWELRRRSSR